MTAELQSAGLAVLGFREGPTGVVSIDAVVGWTGTARALVPRLGASDAHAALGDLLGGARQLRLPIDGTCPEPTSSGLSWLTWALPSIPTHLRDRPLVDAVTGIARGLDEVAA